MTQGNPDIPQKRALIQALKEVNDCSGSQFSPYWVEIFNDVIRDTHIKSKHR